MATAKHPAMLFYLDNHVSQAPLARGDRVLRGRDEGRTNGLNENYARELMELHTVGVDNGYEQEDVIQLALILTGWSIGNGAADRGAFAFREGFHARGPKKVMGRTFKGEGVDEGEDAVRYLAQHKNTRQFVCTKLVRFLVADEPPPAIVKAAVEAWGANKGNLRAVVRAILTHDERDDEGQDADRVRRERTARGGGGRAALRRGDGAARRHVPGGLPLRRPHRLQRPRGGLDGPWTPECSPCAGSSARTCCADASPA
jgi:uncharacterized protein (DUF1800 family)